MLQSNSKFFIDAQGGDNGEHALLSLTCIIYLSEDQSLAFKYDSDAKVVKIDQYDENSKLLFEFVLKKCRVSFLK